VPLASLCVAPIASAAPPVLIAIGTISPDYEDFATQTADPLENGIPGNRLGGMGSGLEYLGGDLFIALPDRGPNAKAYAPCLDDTASYINRFQTIHMSLAPSDPGSALPFTLTPMLIGTTLLSSRTPLVYGTGCGSVGSGVPALNDVDHKHYFTGRSDGFDPSRLSSWPSDARFDPESIRVSRSGRHIFVSDEYGPFIYEFDRSSGKRVRVFTLPADFAIANLHPVGADEISGNTIGRVTNKGMEGLAISPDGRTLFGAMQSPLIQDNGTNGAYTRIVKIDIESGEMWQFAYRFDNIGTAKKPKYGTISDIVAVNGHELLVDERDGKGLGDNSTAVEKLVYHVDLDGADDVTGISGEANLGPHAMAKDIFLDVVATLNGHGIVSEDIPAKLEGLAFGPDVRLDGKWVHTLWIGNDNDFVGTVTDTNHPDGIDNPNKFFVFAIDPASLPNFEAQKFDDGDDDDHFWGGWGDDHHDR
jgi:hypothetical protein